MDLMTIKHEKGLCFSVQVRGHKFLVDMPRDSKGEDRGASPADLLAASLGACMGMHMALYCQTVGLPHEGMEMNLVYNLVEEGGRKRIGSVTVDVLLSQDPGPRGAAILRAGEHCIIRNTLEKGPGVDVEITAGKSSE
ncbi:MAG: OsmC family protein [Thermodesulfobacteriota bacterium]|jgi:putative redox protein